jgi:hypothetical protein
LRRPQSVGPAHARDSAQRLGEQRNLRLDHGDIRHRRSIHVRADPESRVRRLIVLRLFEVHLPPNTKKPWCLLGRASGDHGLFKATLSLLYFTTKMFGTGGGFMFAAMRHPVCGG